MEDREIIGYIAFGMKNEYIKLSKKVGRIRNREISLPDDDYPGNVMCDSIINDLNESIILKSALEQLSLLQKEIIIKYFLLGEKEKDISDELGISRQAVNATKKRALKNLKKILQQDC